MSYKEIRINQETKIKEFKHKNDTLWQFVEVGNE